MHSVPLYFKDTYQFESSCQILESSKDTNGHYFILDQTIFYPQGGGQPSDKGIIHTENENIPINHVRSIQGEIRHYTDNDYSQYSGKQVSCTIDRDSRLLHARLHSAGHLISNIVETNHPEWQAVKGHHFPDQAYVEFKTKAAKPNFDELKIVEGLISSIEDDYKVTSDEVSSNKVKELFPNLAYSIPDGQTLRILKIGNNPFQPCGGTHVSSTKEISGLQILQCKIKGNTLKIKYQI